MDTDVLLLKVYDYDTTTNNDLLGEMEYYVSSLANKPYQEEWRPIMDRKGATKFVPGKGEIKMAFAVAKAGEQFLPAGTQTTTTTATATTTPATAGQVATVGHTAPPPIVSGTPQPYVYTTQYPPVVYAPPGYPHQYPPQVVYQPQVVYAPAQPGAQPQHPPTAVHYPPPGTTIPPGGQ